MNLVHLTSVAFQLNAALDLDRRERITVREAKDHVRLGDIFEWLPAASDASYNFHFGVPNSGVKEEIVEKWRNLVNADIDEQRKFGVRESGICLLLAYTIELIAQKDFE